MDAQLSGELFSRLWHGADYNYEQWLDTPDVLAEDFRLMEVAGCTAMSVGIFAWARLEPAEGQYDFGWLDRLMDELHRRGIRAILATPSAAHPAWLSKKYPEVLRMGLDGRRGPHKQRQNFCRTSPVFREKCTAINTRLAERYRDHPALLLWHVSNEYVSTPCYCPTCLADFRRWLRERYGSLAELNRAWWTTFWSHLYSEWDEIEPVDPSNNGLMLDWKRYNSDQVLDFYRMEIAPLRAFTPHVPVTTNFMRPDVGLDYWKFAQAVDVVCWDSYPEWHVHDDVETALETAFYHDLHRSYRQGQPFYLMECSPSQTNWQPLSRLKRPGMLALASAQAVAHGALGVNYFQWRQSRGGEEKFHGAVVAHRGGESARVFQEVRRVGKMLAELGDLAGARSSARVGLIYDFENEWALGLAHLPRRVNQEYRETCIRHYAHFWRRGIPVDLLSARQALEGYALVIAPMLYVLEEETAARLADFVAVGGALVTTYLTGWVNQSDLCHLGGSPLDSVLGVSLGEYDTFGPMQQARVASVDGNSLGLGGEGTCGRYAELLAPQGAEVLAVYASEFYQGQAAVTANAYGKGSAFHLGTQLDEAYLAGFYRNLSRFLALEPVCSGEIPAGVSAHLRETARQQYLFVLNFTDREQRIALNAGGWSALLEERDEAAFVLPGFGVEVFGREKEQAG